MCLRRVAKLVGAVSIISLLFLDGACQKKYSSSRSSGKYISDIQIKQSFEPTPIIKSSAATQQDIKSRWLVINVSFTTAKKDLPKYRGKKFEWLDGYSMEYDILIKKSIYKGKVVPALLTGKVDYWSIALDGEKHYAQGFVSPKALKRYMDPDAKIKGKTAKEIPSRVSFYSKSRKLIARGYFIPRGSSEGSVREMFAKAAEALGVLKVEDIIFPRSKTPWFVLNFDRYELTKDTKN